MEARELRIGNYLRFPDEIGQVTWLHIKDLAINRPLIPPTPIPLSEEWLEKLGFERSNNINFSDAFYGIAVGGSRLYINPDNGVVWITRNENIFNNPQLIPHVHQLQNLYFALTGEELEVKEKVL